MASLRETLVQACMLGAAKFKPTPDKIKISKAGSEFYPVFEIGGYMPVQVGQVAIDKKKYDVSVKVQISIRESDSSSSVTHSNDIQI